MGRATMPRTSSCTSASSAAARTDIGRRSSTSRRRSRPVTRGRGTSAAGSSTASAFRKSTPRPYRTKRTSRRCAEAALSFSKGRRSARFLLAALLALMVLGTAPASVAARTRLDARVDALTRQQLLTRDASGLVDEGRQRRARTIADLRHVASAGWGIAQILAFWWLWRSGAGARIRDAVRRQTRSRAVQRAVFGAVLGALGAIASLPFALASYRVGFNAGVTDERLPQWFLDYLLRIGLDALLGAVIVVGVLSLVERLRVWYLVVTAALFAGAIAGVAFTPLLPFGPPHKTTPTSIAVVGSELAATVGVPGTPVVVLASSRHSNAMTAHAA